MLFPSTDSVLPTWISMFDQLRTIWVSVHASDTRTHKSCHLLFTRLAQRLAKYPVPSISFSLLKHTCTIFSGNESHLRASSNCIKHLIASISTLHPPHYHLFISVIGTNQRINKMCQNCPCNNQSWLHLFILCRIFQAEMASGKRMSNRFFWKSQNIAIIYIFPLTNY